MLKQLGFTPYKIKPLIKVSSIKYTSKFDQFFSKIKFLTGFTLIEVVIYTALIGIVLTGFISFSLIILANKTKQEQVQIVNNENRALQSFIENELGFAKTIISPDPGLASTTVIYQDQDNQSKTISLMDKALWYISDAGIVCLSSSQVNVNSAQFTHLGTDSILYNWELSTLATSSLEFDYQISHQSAITLLPF